MIPKSYTKGNGRTCSNCKHLIGGYFCSFGEDEKKFLDLLKDSQWCHDNEVYIQGHCDEFETV